MDENWKDVVGFEGIYQISDNGRLRSLDRQVRTKGGGTRLSRGKVILPTKRKDGYIHFMLCDCNANRSTLFAHRLVAEAFIGIKDGQDVNHKDRDRSNNHISNLECVSRRENIHHGHHASGKKIAGAKQSKYTGEYRAHISIGKKVNVIGWYDTLDEATAAYKSKLAEMGEETKYV